MGNKLVLIDGNSIAYRAFFALPLLNNDKGVYTNAVYGFTTMLLKILEEESPDHMLVAFDAGKTTFRHKTYEEYKGGRQKTPPELSEQFPLLQELLDSFGIRHYQLPQYEADDIIGTLARKAENRGDEVTVISGDKDLLQLVSGNVTVRLTKKGITNVETYTPGFLKEKMEIDPEQVIHLKALMGDSSDNIPGVPGVGEKTAVKLLKQFGTLENLYDNLGEVSGKKLKEKLETNENEAYMSKKLVTIELEAPLEIAVTDTAYPGYEPSAVRKQFQDLGFESLINRIGSDEEESKAEMISVEVEKEKPLTEDILLDETALIVEILEDNYHTSPVEAIVLSNEKGVFAFSPEQLMESDTFKTWAADSSRHKWVFDAKRTLVAFKRYGIPVEGITFDVLLASYLVNPAVNNHDIPAISHRLGETGIPTDEEVYGKGAKRKRPEDDVLYEHAGRKALMLYRLKSNLEEQLKQNKQEELFHNLEMPLALILGEMEYTGVRVDVDRLKEMGEELERRLEEIKKRIYEHAGEEFNINSPKQLGPVLFEKLGLPPLKKTKTGYSTAADVLEQLSSQHEIIDEILLYRQLGKLQSTYIEGLLKVVHKETGKVHTRFNQALTQTGRLSSADPNLQNIPIRLEEGRKIRQAFIPSRQGWVMFASDYSQIELRVLAHMSGDEKLIQSFKEGEDVHTKTASEVFGVAPEEVDSDMRRKAKAVNFGIVYGISDYGLSQSLGVSRKDAQIYIDAYFKSYPKVKEYMQDTVQQAKEEGYVETLMNRRRYLPDMNSRNFNRRNAAERTAMNTPIQGTAADIIKKAMIDMAARLKEEKLEATMLMQVHDELILEVPEQEVEKVTEAVREVMEETVELTVPLEVDHSYGKTWFDAK
ncbi:DNA polymerase I [Salimicrobium salexigens]|uniref:DNA polymerase I n=1 Tax=Salimicrobium salexigens TaxID=908941 RepID=A0ABY1KMG7_9BACI|nr:DNA polymerase I [Salimicrobium salexigens]SIS49683.1 DNA polymerase I [Salimicrobium salexigens]